MTNVDDYQIVNWRGKVIRDTAAERDRHREECAARNGEPFAAYVDCPDCGTIAYHWLEEPKLWPEGDSPMERMLLCSWRFDPPGTTVARVCVKCEYRWAQA